MDTDRDLRGLISEVIREETRWLRHYLSQVTDNVDEFNRGRVLVVIPELGFDIPSSGLWCEPRQGNTLSVPKKDDWVEVYFMSGDPNNPVYIFYASEMEGMPLSNYDGEVTTHVLFESPENKISSVYKEDSDELNIGKTSFKESARVDDTTLSDNTTDSAFWAFFNAVWTVVNVGTINEPGLGAPSAFQAALQAAIIGVGGTIPTSKIGKITSGSSQIKIGDK